MVDKTKYFDYMIMYTYMIVCLQCRGHFLTFLFILKIVPAVEKIIFMYYFSGITLNKSCFYNIGRLEIKLYVHVYTHNTIICFRNVHRFGTKFNTHCLQEEKHKY